MPAAEFLAHTQSADHIALLSEPRASSHPSTLHANPGSSRIARQVVRNRAKRTATAQQKHAATPMDTLDTAEAPAPVALDDEESAVTNAPVAGPESAASADPPSSSSTTENRFVQGGGRGGDSRLTAAAASSTSSLFNHHRALPVPLVTALAALPPLTQKTLSRCTRADLVSLAGLSRSELVAVAREMDVASRTDARERGKAYAEGGVRGNGQRNMGGNSTRAAMKSGLFTLNT
ncbi:hypothetical protein HKX48_003209 [Thoreauomyces humboldtii]|nr:hypothetical protein HKX48_003209 [Thoreauomyces humboldtii]